MFVVNNLPFPAGCCIITPDSCSHVKCVRDSTPTKYLVAPFGLTNTPADFQVNIVRQYSMVPLCGQLFSKTREECIQQFKLVFQQLLENKLGPHQSSVSLHHTAGTTLSGPPLPPGNSFSVSFDFANFIQDYRKVASPHTGLTSTLKLFQWSDGVGTAFRRLKTQSLLPLSCSLWIRAASSSWS